MTVCLKCGIDHDKPGTPENAAKVLACAMPEITFVTRDGPVDARARRMEL